MFFGESGEITPSSIDPILTDLDGDGLKEICFSVDSATLSTAIFNLGIQSSNSEIDVIVTGETTDQEMIVGKGTLQLK